MELLEKYQLLDRFGTLYKNNIAKNVIKAFFTYLLDTKNNDLLSDFFISPQSNLIQASKVVRSFFKKIPFNNKSL